MADKPASNPTEKPTPERLRKARQEGQVPQSSEVSSALALVMLLVVLALTAPMLSGWFAREARQGLSFGYERPDDMAGFSSLLKAKAIGSLLTIMPFMLGAAVVSVLGSLVVSGWTFSPKAVKVNWEKMSPAKGIKNLISMKSVVQGLVALAKMVLVLVLVYDYLRDKMEACLWLQWNTPTDVLTAIARLVFGLVVRVTIGMVVIAALDMLYQKRRYIRDLKMTRQEVKEERKRYEIAPEIKGRIRAAQYDISRKRMLQDVPQADVVLANPTHVAVALKYDQSSMDAPRVVAKGADFLSEKIKEIARINNVPVLQRPKLARTIYETVKIGQAIPETLFVAVAEVLALIHRLRNRLASPTASDSR